MESLSTMLKSPVWWFSVVIVGVVVSVIGAFLYKIIERTFGRLIKKSHTRSEKVRNERNALIQSYVDNPSEIEDIKYMIYLDLGTSIAIEVLWSFIGITFFIAIYYHWLLWFAVLQFVAILTTTFGLINRVRSLIDNISLNGEVRRRYREQNKTKNPN